MFKLPISLPPKKSSGRNDASLLICLRLVFFFVLVFMVGITRFLPPSKAYAASNPIQQENSLPGDPTWDDFSSVAQQDAISGYGSSISVNHGSSLDLFVTTTAPSFTIDIFRTGWYGGVGARKISSLGSFPGIHQAIPTPDSVTGMIACKWTKTTTLSIPTSWVTGVYLAKLTASNGNKSFIYFVIRNDSGNEDIVLQTSVTTYQAYNAWGGTSLYTNTTNNSVYKYPHATKVSFNRPFDPDDSNGAGHYLYFEYQFVRWAESQGYNLTYITDVDTQTNINPLTHHKAFLSVGHDEYWSKGMRDNVQNAINAGVNTAFFSANSAYWQIRFEPDAAGTANRVEVGYKDFATATTAPGPDPLLNVNNAIVTTNWRSSPVNMPENALLGVMYQDQVNSNYPYIVQNAASWVYAGTGFVNGSSVPGIVGYEYDKVWNNGFSPAGLTILSNSPVVGCCEGSGHSYSNSTLYTASSGARVFAAGTIQWSWGLDNYGGNNFTNAGIQRTTANILNNFTSSTTPLPQASLSPTSLTFGNQLLNTSSASQAVTITNSGTASLTISSITTSGTNAGDFSQTNTCPTTLAVATNCTINVAFKPAATGTRTATLQISDNVSGSPQSVVLSGSGVATSAPAIGLNPNGLTFTSQTVGTTSATQTITLTNTGSAILTLNSISLAGTKPGDFVQTNTCPVSPNTLAVNGKCTINVQFQPATTGSSSATVSISDNAAGSPHVVALSGTGSSTSNTLFNDGFESGSLPGAWTGTTVDAGNSVTLDTTLKHSGNASLKATVAQKSNGNAIISKTLAGQTTLDVRGYYYLSNPSNFGAVNLLSLYGQSNFIGWTTYNADPSAPTFTVYNGATNELYSCTLPSLNAWHAIELQYVLATTGTGSFTLWLDGVKACGATSLITSPQSGLTIDQVNVGSDTADNTVGLTVHVDDVAISKAYIGL